MSNIEFYTKKDVSDSLLLSNNGLTIADAKVNLYITETNNEYERLCAGVGVTDDDIMLNDPSTEIDERNSAMVLLCEWFFLSRCLFSLSKSENDIYWIKYKEADKKYKEYRNLVSSDKVAGEEPPVRKASTYMSVPMFRG